MTITKMVRETAVRKVPVTVCKMVTTQQVKQVPVTTCRMVTEVRTCQVPVTTCRMVHRNAHQAGGRDGLRHGCPGMRQASADHDLRNADDSVHPQGALHRVHAVPVTKTICVPETVARTVAETHTVMDPVCVTKQVPVEVCVTVPVIIQEPTLVLPSARSVMASPETTLPTTKILPSAQY